jgi:hypothetical protein
MRITHRYPTVRREIHAVGITPDDVRTILMLCPQVHFTPTACGYPPRWKFGSTEEMLEAWFAKTRWQEFNAYIHWPADNVALPVALELWSANA